MRSAKVTAEKRPISCTTPKQKGESPEHQVGWREGREATSKWRAHAMMQVQGRAAHLPKNNCEVGQVNPGANPSAAPVWGSS